MTRSLAARALPPAAFALMFALFAACAGVASINHDESQYVAAAVLTASGSLVFRDFLSLQPPLHAWLFAPVALAWPEHVFVAMRLATAALAAATVMLVHGATRALGTPSRPALAAAILFGCCDSVQFAAGIVRNDMLPAALAAAALWLAARALRTGGRAAWLAAGIALGLAASTKLSYAPFGAAGIGFLLWSAPDRRALAPFAGGLALGLLPVALCFAVAPAAFVFGVVTYGATAPFRWYAAIGQAAELGLGQKALDLLVALLSGAGLVALGLVAAAGWRAARRPGGRDRARLFLLAMLAAGAIGAALPTPTHRQYLLPLLVPLFVALGPVLAMPRGPAERRRVVALLAIFGLGGLSGTLGHVAGYVAGGDGLPALVAERDAGWIGARLAARGARGAIATFSPERVVDAGLAIDPRFATGPFVFRSGALLGADAATALDVLIPANLAAGLDRVPPAAILTGYESRRRNGVIPPDAYLDGYARARGYARMMLPDGIGRLLIRPVAAR